MSYNEDFKKASFKDVIKFKIKWIVIEIKWIVKIIWKCVNYPFDRLEEKMYLNSNIEIHKFLNLW